MADEEQEEWLADFEGTEEERMKLEIAMLKLQIQAEFGADFETAGGEGASPDELPLEVQQAFLEMVLKFHRHKNSAEKKPIFELLGKPSFKEAKQLTEAELAEELEALVALYEAKSVNVSFRGEYSSFLKYRFLAEELPRLSIAPPMEGVIICLCYEDYYPNAELDQRDLCQSFFEAFFACQPDEMMMEFPLTNPVTFENYSGAELGHLIGRFHEVFDEIRDWSYEVTELRKPIWTAPKEEEYYEGWVAGTLSYTIVQAGELQEVSGPFKVYQQFEDDVWTVSFFELFGFSWK
ncbi:MAG: hypothetical protein JST36_02970 [Bacteroidetes bacterium]|nr:hypothetical protein [Bacteroidota bacterium]